MKWICITASVLRLRSTDTADHWVEKDALDRTFHPKRRAHYETVQ